MHNAKTFEKDKVSPRCRFVSVGMDSGESMQACEMLLTAWSVERVWVKVYLTRWLKDFLPCGFGMCCGVGIAGDPSDLSSSTLHSTEINIEYLVLYY